MAEDNKTVMPDGAEHAQGPDNLTEHPPAPEVSVPPAPDVEGGEVVVPSNVIDGLFEDKRAAAKEAEKQAAGEQHPEKKEARRGRPPKGDKQAANVSGGGVSGKSAGKEDTAPVVPDPPPPPRDATRPGETEQIVYIAHADLHPFKGHPFEVRDDDLCT